MNTDRISMTAWLYVAIAFLTVLDVFVELSWIAPFTSGLIVLFIVIEFKNIPRYQRAAGAILAMIGLAGAAASGRWDAVVLDAIARSRAFLLLFFAVSWLQIPAGRSPSLRVVRTAILSQPPGRRFLFLSYGIHVLASILNLAGLSLFSTVVKEQKDFNLKRRVAMALIQGFTSASCWSPFYVGMIVVLVAIPTLKWSDVAPSGAMLALTLIMTGWLYDRYAVRQSTLPSRNPARSELSALKISQAILILTLLVASVMALLELTGVAIPVALGLVSPPFAIIWFALIEFQPHTTIEDSLQQDLSTSSSAVSPSAVSSRPNGSSRVAAGNLPRKEFYRFLICSLTPQSRPGGTGNALAVAVQRGVELTGKVVGGLPGLRNEAMVFVAANILGLGVASAIPAADFSSVIIQIIPWADARIFLLFAIFVVCGFVGIHPVIVILFISSVLTPEALGLRDWIVGVVYSACWGLCTMISPFSGTTLFMARETGTPAHVIAWQWASQPTLLQALAIFLVTIAIRHATL